MTLVPKEAYVLLKAAGKDGIFLILLVAVVGALSLKGGDDLLLGFVYAVAVLAWVILRFKEEATAEAKAEGALQAKDVELSEIKHAYRRSRSDAQPQLPLEHSDLGVTQVKNMKRGRIDDKF